MGTNFSVEEKKTKFNKYHRICKLLMTNSWESTWSQGNNYMYLVFHLFFLFPL